MDKRAHLRAIFIRDDNLGARTLRGNRLRSLIDVAIRVSGNGDRLFPGGDKRLDAADKDRRTEHGAVQDCTDGAVGALPHLLELIFFHALRIRRDGGALNGDAILFRRFRRLDGDAVVGPVTVFQSEVIILGFQVDIRKKKLLLDHFPDDAGHFIAVHLYKRRFHLNFSHCSSPSSY